MAITQLSLFLNNQPGQLVDAVSAISDLGANLRAMSIAEANDFGILRTIVSDPEKVYSQLKERFLIARNHVVAARMDDRSGALREILDVLNQANVNIEYMYAFTGIKNPGHAFMVFRVAETKAAEVKLAAMGLKIVTQDDLAVI